MKEDKPVFAQCSFATSVLRKRFTQDDCAEGDVLDATELEELTRKTWETLITSGHIRRAANYAAKERRIVWLVVRGCRAVKCLGSRERVELADSFRKSIHRKSKKTMVILSATDRSKLGESELPKYNALVAMTGALVNSSSHRMSKSLQLRPDAGAELPRMLENMSKVAKS